MKTVSKNLKNKMKAYSCAFLYVNDREYGHFHILPGFVWAWPTTYIVPFSKTRALALNWGWWYVGLAVTKQYSQIS